MKLLGKVSVWVRSLVRGPAISPRRKTGRHPSPPDLPIEPAAHDPADAGRDLEEGRVADLLQQKLERSQAGKGEHS